MANNEQRRTGSVLSVAKSYLLALTVLVSLGCLAYDLGSDYAGWPPLAPRQLLLWGLGAWGVLCGFCPMIVLAWHQLVGSQANQQTMRAAAPAPSSLTPVEPPSPPWLPDLKEHMRAEYGLFWQSKVRILLVAGEPEEIEAIAPGLAKDLWQASEQALLLWAGSPLAEASPALVSQWRGLRRWYPLDGVVWALSPAQSTDAAALRTSRAHLHNLSRKLGWQLPLHIWQVCDHRWSQSGRETQPVGTLLSARVNEAELKARLDVWLEPLLAAGMAQVAIKMHYDFLARLSRDLRVEGIARWQKALAPWFVGLARNVPLRGIWFSQPLERSKAELEHTLAPQPAWAGLLNAPLNRQKRVGWGAPRITHALVLGVAAIWAIGLLLSFTSNREHITSLQATMTAAEQPGDLASQLLGLRIMVSELGQLTYRVEHGAPWYQRFGLDKNPELLERTWPRYTAANNRLLRDPLAANLEQALHELASLPPDSPARAQRASNAYNQLKAYLMMARPDKSEPLFLARVLASVDTSGNGLMPDLLQFYAEQLPAHPAWAIEADPVLVAKARQVLLGQLGQRNAESALYQQVLDSAVNNYPAINLAQLAGETDPAALFKATGSVPGVFTRQAWEGQIRAAIDKIAEARREEIDWVLSENPGDIAAELTPDVLKQRLTARYFQEYSNAWLRFLNSLRWRQAGSLAEVIDQLTLMSDTRQSPLIAVLNNLAYQGQAGQRGQALADSLLKSAQKLIKNDNDLPFEQPLQGGPLDATFGPLLSLLGKGPDTLRDTDRLSLQAFLTRVTRVRLKLQQISQASDPQDMTQALAQTVFQGKNLDLTDTQAYGSLVAASLGAEWGTAGQALFVQPLEQAWQRVLQPSAAGLNSQWKRAIVEHWNSAFVGRYPFAATSSDASLPMLGQMIRANTGRIEQFLHSQLSGVLRKEGSQWVADTRHSQGLRIDPKFLAAINRLSHLSDVLFTDGGLGLSFELSATAVQDLVETVFILNGEKHHYFNQRESWQRFGWPGRGNWPGVQLTWASVHANTRLFGDYQGTWGLIRLLEQAKVTPLDDGQSRYRIVLTAPDGIGLTWHLRTELGAGPLALLDLRGFELPSEIFLTAPAKSKPKASKRGA